MSEQQLTRDEKITAILELNGVHEDHHDDLREHLDLLTDDIIDRQYTHCLLIQAGQEGDPDVA